MKQAGMSFKVLEGEYDTGALQLEKTVLAKGGDSGRPWASYW